MPPVIDRPISDIIMSITRLIVDGKIKGQLARDLEKLCVAAQRGGEEPPREK